MGLFSRKKTVEQDIPKLPELPKPKQQPQAFLPKSEIPDVPSGLPKIETQTLPILPESEVGKDFNLKAIKQAVSKPEQETPTPEPSEPTPTPEPLEPQLRAIPPAPIKKQPVIKRTAEIPAVVRPKKLGVTEGAKPLAKEIKPVFVRLDKFQTAIETFEEIKNKIFEIEELLQKTREIKAREEQELTEWEREIQIIKSRIDLIDKNIFNQLD